MSTPPNTITMSEKDLRRFEVLSQLHTTKDAAEQLGVTTRHVRRLRARVAECGAKGLVHGNTGKPSNRRVNDDVRGKVSTLLTTTYVGYGPTLAAEKLKERDGIVVSDEWLRTFMTETKCWKPKERKHREIHREWRPRMARVGSMEQFDGSYHTWFGGSESCLLASIDDASGEITKLTFADNEGIVPVFTFWKERAEAGTLPARIYVDKFSTYKVNHEKAVDEPEMLTQFEGACGRLGVTLIRAHSPQAKGRIERLFGTLQDRLVKELRLRGITTRAAANAYLAEYIEDHNRRFGVVPREDGTRYVSTTGKDLDAIFSCRFERKVNMDFTVRFKNGWYQIEKVQDSTVRSKDVVIVEVRLDGSVHMILKRTDRYLRLTSLPERPKQVLYRACIPATTRTPYVPPPAHPWRQHTIGSRAPRTKTQNTLLTT